MKKRLLSLVLCLVMVFSLLPVGTLAIERPEEQYVALTGPWTTTTNYAGLAAANGSQDGKLYYKDGEAYKEVSWDTNQQLYSISGLANKDWTPAEVAGGTYYYNVDSDKLTFSQTSTKSGYLYYVSQVQVPDEALTSDDEDMHINYYIWKTNYFIRDEDTVTAEGGFSRLMFVNYGSMFQGFLYKGWLYYFPDGRYNATGSSKHIVKVNRPSGRSDPPQAGKTEYYVPGTVVHVSMKDANGNDTTDGVVYRWWTDHLQINTTTYLRTNGANSIWYNNGNDQLGSTVYLTSGANNSSTETAYTGTLYSANGTGSTKLMDKATGNTISGVTRSAINGDTIYTGDLYVLKKAPLPQPEPTSIITTEETGEDGVYTHKALETNGDAYDITLTAYTTGNEVKQSETTITPTVNPMDIVMVIDQSGSMATQDMGSNYSPAATPKGGWTMDAATGGKQYYYSPDNGLTHYPVQADMGYVYEKVERAPRASDMLNNGDDAISLGVNGAPTYYNIKTDYYVMYNGELHRLYLITAGLFLQYGLYPYIYTDNNDSYTTNKKWQGNNYWVAVFDPWDGSDLRDNGTWDSLTNKGAASSRVSFVDTNGAAIGSTDANADTARLSYSWFTSSDRIENLYQLSNSKVANRLYYVDAAGNRQYIGDTAQFEGDVVYTGTLYEGTGTSRVDALKAAVTQFAEKVSENALINPEHPVNHRMAFVGFAGNKVPAYSLGSEAVTVGANGLKDYTNTGLFNSGSLPFENYERITGYQDTSDNYINRHYYRNNGATLLKYINGAWNMVNLNNGATSVSYSGNWTKATYEGSGTSLSPEEYRSALLSVNEGNSLNSRISSTISSFAANGGTYTSYGMSMAEQLYQAVDAAGDTMATNSEGESVARKRVIVVFTDGEPGGNGYESSIAGEALAAGNTVQKGPDGKSGTADDVLIYTVGLFKGAPSSQVADFMQKLSSEFSMDLAPVYGGNDNDNYSLGSLDPNKTYYYKNETTGKYYAVTTEYGTGSSLGWWIYNGSASGETESYSLTNPRRSTGAGTTVFYNSRGSSVNGEDVKTGTTYYTSGGDKIVYEYRWFDSDRSIKNPFYNTAGSSTNAGESRVQFYDLAGAAANSDSLNYYMTASNAAELNNVFAQIAGSIVEEETTVANNSKFTEDTLYVMDEISADFDLPADLSATNNHVTVYADTVSEWNADGSPKTYNESTTPLRQGDAAAIEAGSADVEVVWSGKKVQINYFDFGRMYMQESNPNAARIRVVIDGVTPNKVGEKLYSNTPQSGLYYKDPQDDSVTLVEAFNRPYISVDGYTVTWMNGSEQKDQDVDLLKGDVPVYDGDEPTKDPVENNTSRTTYQFDYWVDQSGSKVYAIRNAETGVIVGYDVDQNAAHPSGFPAVVDHDVTYTAHFAESTSNFYTATWFNGSTQLYQQEKLAVGDVPVYGGHTPEKESDDDSTYFFAGWRSEADYNSYGDAYDASPETVITQLPEINEQDGSVNYYAVFASIAIGHRTFVVDYGIESVLETNVKRFDVMVALGGDFALNKENENAQTGDLTFTPKLNSNSGLKSFTATGSREFKVYDATGMSQANTAVYYKDVDNKEVTTKVSVIAASNIYLDDTAPVVSVSLTDTSDPNSVKLNDQEYKAELNDASVGKSDNDTAKVEYAQPIALTFTGTAIEVYAKTNATSKTVIAYLLDESGNRVNGAASNISSSTGTLYNVPVFRYEMEEYGTYTLVLIPSAQADFQLDGVRVFNPQNNKTNYLNLRKSLLENADVFRDADDATQFEGALYLVGNDPTTDIAAYTKKGPNNEIYLSKGESVMFIAPAGSNYKIGMSAVDGTATAADKTNVTVSYGLNEAGNAQNTQYTVNNAIHMYYEVIPSNGMVMIKNTGDGVISLTDLQYTGVSRKLTVSRSLMSYAAAFSENPVVEPEVVEPEVAETPAPTAEPTPTPTPDTPDEPTPTPSISNWLSQLFSSFVSSLFGSISRLFGGH